MATLKLLQPGLWTLLVDEGRPGWRSLGVPVGGASDRTALALGNALVGNDPAAAALEVTLHGPTVVADAALACVLQGAPFALTSDRQRLVAGKTFTLQPGEELAIGTTPRGMRAYFCVRGGLEGPLILGSRSDFEPLRAGAEVACQAGAIRPRFLSAAVEEELRRPWGAVAVLRVLDGPQADWFPAGALIGSAEDQRTYEVTPASNRMGLRLHGVPLPLPGRELVSEPVCPGSVQVTRDGQTVILGVDGQTIGGYPKIAQVIGADLDLLGQLRPGDRIRFQPVTLDVAEELYRQKRKVLAEWLARLRATEL
jgi:biotin-dependent carboxylase-like uncharacterized protein